MTTVAIAPAVAEAIEEIRATFEGAIVSVEADGEGGAYVRVDPLIQARRTPSARRGSGSGSRPSTRTPTCIRCSSGMTCAGQTARRSGRASPRTHTFDGQPAVQVSRRSNHLNPATDTAAIKVLKVLSWMASR